MIERNKMGVKWEWEVHVVGKEMVPCWSKKILGTGWTPHCLNVLNILTITREIMT